MEKRTEEISQLKKAVAELSALNDLSISVNSAMTVDDICLIIVKKAIEYLNASQGAIFILSEEESHGEIFKTFVRAADESNNIIPFHLNELIKNWIIDHRKPLLFNSKSSHPGLDTDLLRNEGIITLAGVPLFGRGDIIGIMIMFNKKDGQAFGDDDIRFLSILGVQTAKSLESMMLFRDIQERHMKTISKLVAGFSHEFNSPIGAIVGAADTLSRSVESLKIALDNSAGKFDFANPSLRKSTDALTNSMTVIRKGKSRVENILRRLRDFINLDQAKKRVVNINDCIDGCLRLLDYKIDPQRITLVKNFESEAIAANCVPAQINQVLFDVIENAIESISGAGLIEINAVCNNGIVEVTIRDSGSGIDGEILNGIFEPGFSTKRVEMGLGIGLPLCKQILKNHSGDIFIDSRIGEGTTVTLRFPSDVRPLI
jgi:signal transduction histidine kinase